MSDLPEPLVPTDVDLRDFSWMPVDIVRLFNSEFHALSDDATWRAGFTLWLKSYHQVPASSIPDDDIALARLAELGRDLKAGKKLRAGALRGWVKCSDGRLYHPVVAEKALEAWIEKLVQRKSSAAGNAKRYGTPFDPAPFDKAIGVCLGRLSNLNPNSRILAKRLLKGAGKPDDGTPESLPPGDDEAPTGSVETSHRETGGSAERSHRDAGGTATGTPESLPPGSQGTGQDKKEEESSPETAVPASPGRKTYPVEFEEKFWKPYPRSDNMSKFEAGEAWAKLSAADRAAAIAAVPGFVAHCRKNPDYTPIYADRFLRKRRFESYAEKAQANGHGPGGDARIDFGGGITAAEPMVVEFLRRGDWLDQWGARPGQPGCRLPERIIQAAALDQRGGAA